MRRFSISACWRLAFVALVLVSAPAGWTSGGADTGIVRELLASSRGQRAERILRLAAAQPPDELRAVFEAGEPLWQGLADALAEGGLEDRSWLLHAAAGSPPGRASLQGALALLPQSRRSEVLAGGLLDPRDPVATATRQLLRGPWLAELIGASDSAATFRALGPVLQAQALQALAQSASPDGIDPLEALDRLARSAPREDLVRRLAEMEPAAVALWLERAAADRRGFRPSDQEVYWPALLLGATLECHAPEALRQVAAKVQRPDEVRKLLGAAARSPSPLLELLAGAPAAEPPGLMAELLAAPRKLQAAEIEVLLGLPVHAQGRLQRELEFNLAREQAWPTGARALKAPAGRPQFDPPAGPAHPLRDVLLDWTERLRAALGPDSVAVLCAGWSGDGAKMDCPGPLPAPCRAP